MEEQKKQDQEIPKYTESQMQAACNQIYQEMSRKLQQANMGMMLKRLDYLFKVMEFKECFDSGFVISCTEEIKAALTVPEQQEGDKEEKEEAK